MTRVVGLGGERAVAKETIPDMKEAALSLATPQLRNVGTVGGSRASGRAAGTIASARSSPQEGGYNCFAFQATRATPSSAAGAAYGLCLGWRRP